MKLKKAASMHNAHIFTDMVKMNFRPPHSGSNSKQSAESQSIVGRLQSLMPWGNANTNNSPKRERGGDDEEATDKKIKYLLKITSETYLIGNENSLDLINLGGVVDSFVDTEHMWSLNIKKPIKNLAVDLKKSYLAIYTGKQIQIYHYDPKKSDKPKYFVTIKTQKDVKFLRFPKDCFLVVFYERHLDVHVVADNLTTQKKLMKHYNVKPNMKLFQIPMPFEQTLNIFFEDNYSDEKSEVFGIWVITMTFTPIEIKISDPYKVYDTPVELKGVIKLENYSQEIFLMSLGNEIVAAKKSYIIDSAKTNVVERGSSLQYLGNKKIIHITTHKVEIYHFQIDFSVKPNRISIRSIDSIAIEKPVNHNYLTTLEMLSGNFAVFYQIQPSHNIKLKGQIDYAFALSQNISIEEKLSQIFNFTAEQLRDPGKLPVIEQRCDVARKLGLDRKEIYLELWNRTKKESVEDIQFLLDTLDYETIRKEVEKKLKKSSMKLKSVCKIEESCFFTLRQQLYSSEECTEDVIKNYICSHFFLRKLQLFKEISVNEVIKKERKMKAEGIEPESKKEYMINIQQYHNYKKAEIKSFFLQFIQQFCFEDKDLTSDIRIFLRAFRFPFRICYKDLLADIISATKKQLLKLLTAIPQLLPYKHVRIFASQADFDYDDSFFEGIWTEISESEWQNNLHIEGISTIYNKELVDETSKSIWFKRNSFTQHDLIPKSKQEILEIDRENKSQQIFYYFIAKVFEEIKEQEPLQELMQLLQTNYTSMPVHLKGNIFLYKKLYDYFQLQGRAKNNDRYKQFCEFLRLKDYQLFREFFEFQKCKKGFILKQVKPIYEEISTEGAEIFNEGLLHYFASDLSEISDLKYILNRMNNEKREFHSANEKMYQVLVKGMQMKMKLGSDRDIPIDDVLIYIENIPLQKENNIMEELLIVQRINEESERFKKMKLNMTIKEIIENCENVMTAIINYEIEDKGVLETTDEDDMLQKTYDILAEVQTVKENIYKTEYSDLSFFIYLSKIMQKIELIPFAKRLLEDDSLANEFSIDERIIENLVLYMYKWKFSQCIFYSRNQQYIRGILELLPQESECRMFIELELEFAVMLSTDLELVEYPLTNPTSVLSIIEFETIISKFPGKFLPALDLNRIYEIIKRMQELCYEESEVNDFVTTISQVYEVIIMRMIECFMIKEVIDYIKQILTFDENSHFSIVYPLILVIEMMTELSEENKVSFLKIVSYLFREPEALLEIIETLVTGSFSPSEQKHFFLEERKKIESSKDQLKNYNEKNYIMEEEYFKAIQNEEMENNFQVLVEQTGTHLAHSKQEFNRSLEFSIIYIMLVHQPYTLAKYIYCRKYSVNLKLLRTYLSYAIQQDIFNAIKVIEFARRMFNILYESLKTSIPLETIISQYYSTKLDDDVQFNDWDSIPVDNTDLQKKIRRNIAAFDRKKLALVTEAQKKSQKDCEVKIKKIQRQLISPVDFSEKEISDYPFPDSDDEVDPNGPDKLQLKKTKREKEEFDPKVQRNKLMAREGKNLVAFLGADSQEINLTQSVRQNRSPRLRPLNSLSVDINSEFNSLRISSSSSKVRKKHSDGGERDSNLEEEIDTKSMRNSNHYSDYSAKEPKSAMLVPHQQRMDFEQIDSSDEEGLKFSGEFREFNVKIYEVDENKMPQEKKIVEEILEGTDDKADSLIFDLSPLALLEQRDNFNEYLMSLISNLYAHAENKPLSVLLQLIHQLCAVYPTLRINKSFLNIYIKFEGLLKKYSLKLPWMKLMPVEGLFLESKLTKDLLDLISPSILEHVDENILVTLTSIINISFKPANLGPYFTYLYLCRALEKYNCESEVIDEVELNRRREKLRKLIEKLPLGSVKELRESMQNTLLQHNRKPEIIALIEEVQTKKGG